MNRLPELLTGSITAEYAAISTIIRAQEEQTQTCGSDCSEGECEPDETCGQKKEEEHKQGARKPVKAFRPVVEGWNEPPAARL